MSFARLDDLKPHRVAVEFRTPPQSLLATREGFSVSTYRSAEDAVDAVARKEVDAAFVWGPIAGHLNLKKFASAYRVVPVAGEGMQFRVGIGVRKSEEALRRRIDEALSQLQPEIRRIAALTSAHGVRLAPRAWGSGVLFAASIHVAMAAPNCHISR